jgi:CspA family cold shock protein
MAREIGVVKWFSREKGYGFVRRENGEEVFVHHSDIDGDGFRALRQGEAVEFEIVTNDRGPRAARVERLEKATGPELRDSSASRDGRRGRQSPGRGGGPARKRPGSPRRESASVGTESLRTLAEQLRDRLGSRFAGFRD